MKQLIKLMKFKKIKRCNKTNLNDDKLKKYSKNISSIVYKRWSFLKRCLNISKLVKIILYHTKLSKVRIYTFLSLLTIFRTSKFEKTLEK